MWENVKKFKGYEYFFKAVQMNSQINKDLMSFIIILIDQVTFIEVPKWKEWGHEGDNHI